MKETSVQNYELMVIFLSEIGEAAINKELEELKKYISSNEGEVLQEDTWGIRDMAFRIKKQDKGFYYVMNFKLDTAKVGEMQRALVINPTVIRALIVKEPEKYIFRTFAEYQDEEEKAKAIKEEAKREKEAKKNQSGPKPRPEVKRPERPARTAAPAPKAEVKEEKKAPVEKAVEEEAPKKAEKKTKKEAPSKVKLDEVDAKLKSIIDDPDIIL
jgi:small subunit ribosomal protein S6